jgi:hypothetical protein
VDDDLTSVFRPYDRKEPKLDFLNRDKFVIGIEQARYKEIPSNYKKLSANEIHLAREELDHDGLFGNKLVKRLFARSALTADLAASFLEPAQRLEGGSLYQVRNCSGLG